MSGRSSQIGGGGALGRLGEVDRPPHGRLPLGGGVEDAQAVALLRRMLEIPSLSRDEGRLAAALVEWMNRHGYRARADEVGNAVGEIGAEDAARTVVLLGHMDTVPGDIPVQVVGDVLSGRGAVDAKGPLATFLVAGARAKLPAGVKVVVVGAVEEEATTSRGARHVVTRYRPDACVIGEPSEWCGVTIGYKGRLVVRFTVRTSGAHSAGPNMSACDRVMGWWSDVLGVVERINGAVEHRGDACATGAKSAGVFERVQASVRSVRSSGDGLEDIAEVVAGFRLPPGVRPEELEEQLCALESTACGELIASGGEVAHVADRSNAVVRALNGAIRRERGKPAVRVKTGTADFNVVGPVWGCPIAAYGPGDSSLDHTPDEHIRISEFLAAVRVLTSALEGLGAELAAEEKR